MQRLEVSGAVRLIYRSLDVKGLSDNLYSGYNAHRTSKFQKLYIKNYRAPAVLVLLLYVCCNISRCSSVRIVNSPWDG